MTWVLTALLLAVQDGARELERAVASRDPSGTKAAAGTLVRSNDAESARALVKSLASLSPQDEDLYWVVIKALASFTAPEPLEEVAGLVVGRRGSSLSADVMFMLIGNEAEAVGVVLAAVLEKGSDDLKEMAVNHSVTVRSPRVMDALINELERAVKRKKADAIERIVRTLGLLTGVDYGTSASNWRGWWDKQRPSGLPEPGERKAAGAGGGTVVESLDPKRGDEFERLKGPIVVIKGECRDKGHGIEHNYDHIEQTLAKMSIPHTVISKEQFEHPSFKANDQMAILINCHYWRFHCQCTQCYKIGGSGKTGPRSGACPPNCPQGHDQHEYKMSDMGIAKLRGFVQQGGFLFTEDWQLEEIVERAFAGIVEHGDYLPDQVVTIYAKPGSTSHPYLRRIFAKPPKVKPGGGTVSEAEFESIKHEWKIDADSPSIVLKSSAATVLLVSPDLEKSNKGNAAVAITFPHVKGQVMHVLSHFGKQKKEEDEFALQNLMLNFILDASERWNLAKKKERRGGLGK